MSTSPFFKWEDHQALMHHCGVCGRVLASKGAKNTCFGEHAEPCIRFHQILFMRNRGHTCDACTVINEAHHKRHQKIALILREIRELCGVAGGLVREIRNTTTSAPDPDIGGLPSGENGLSTTRKEKKEAKRLEKAAGRAKVITLQEYYYIDEVLHPPVETRDPGSHPDPMNLEEVQEIEKNLRFNAAVWANRKDRRDQVKGCNNKFQAVEFDFSAELDRIFEVFHIDLFIKDNERNRGLQGRSLKVFEQLVRKFRSAVVDDFVLIKRDEMETRMRRAGFLRYTNRAILEKLLDRYEDRDWRTGLRLQSPDVLDEMETETGVEQGVDDEPITEQPSPTPAPAPYATADRRHLQKPKQRLTFVMFKEVLPDGPKNNPRLRGRVLSEGLPSPHLTDVSNISRHRPRSKTQPLPAPPSEDKAGQNAEEPKPTPESAKKAKKKKREAIRKAKRQAEREKAEREKAEREKAERSEEDAEQNSDPLEAEAGAETAIS